MKNIKKPQYLRFFVTALLLLVWAAVAAYGGPAFGGLSKITSNDQSTYLPSSADATKVQKLEAKFVGQQAIPAIVVVESKQRLTVADLRQLTILHKSLLSIPGISATVGNVVGPLSSKDGKAAEYIVQLGSDTDKLKTAVKQMRTTVVGGVPNGTTGYVTGPAGIYSDLFTAFSGIDSTLLYVAVAAVFIILIFVYRSIILPFLVLSTAIMALCGAGLVVHHSVTVGWLKLNSQSQGILSILAIGAATDYSLLLVARFHEALEQFESKWEAITHAVRWTIEPVTASAATVIAGVLCLLFSQLNSNKDLGPVAAFGILFSYLAAMTLLPALLFIFGRLAFWPFRPKIKYAEKTHAVAMAADFEHRKGLWGVTPRLIERHPRIVWLACLMVLLMAVFAVPQFKADGISQSDAILGKSDAVAGEKVLARHFPAGSGSPVAIIINPLKLASDMKVITQTPGVGSVVPYSRAVLLPTQHTIPMPSVVDGRILLLATMNVEADSKAGQQVVRNLRSRLPPVDSSVLVGGTTAVSIDTNQAAVADLHKIIPIVLVVILLILMILLRSMLAPTLLIASVILSFAATIGGSALVFNHIFHFPGSDATIPLFGFIFLVALGVDYNIFLMTRVREESMKAGTPRGILRGLSVTGGVITSAGIVLAATFASLSVIPVLFLAQIAFIVTSGVLVDTLVVRTLLVPALCYDIGKLIWWPTKLWRNAK